MAEYGYVDRDYRIYFNPDSPAYWYSVKSWTESSTWVPKPYLGLLMDLTREKLRHLSCQSNATYKRPKIRFDSDRQMWVLDGYGFSWDDQKTRDWLNAHRV